MVSKALQVAVRAWEFLWTLLVMALIGNIIASAFSGNPSTINYAMFVSAFSMASLLYLVPASIKDEWSIHWIFKVVLDALNAIFFFTAGIALAAKLTSHSCNNNLYTLTNEVTNGSFNREKRCREAQASTAFLWFAWAGYTLSLILSIFDSRGGGGGGRGRPARPGRPSMSQV